MTEGHELPEAVEGADPWSAVLAGQELVPAYLTSPLAAQYRAIVEVLLAEQDTSLTGLSYDMVDAGLRAYLGERSKADHQLRRIEIKSPSQSYMCSIWTSEHVPNTMGP